MRLAVLIYQLKFLYTSLSHPNAYVSIVARAHIERGPPLEQFLASTRGRPQETELSVVVGRSSDCDPSERGSGSGTADSWAAEIAGETPASRSAATSVASSGTVGDEADRRRECIMSEP